jgi:hypothetical protein
LGLIAKQLGKAMSDEELKAELETLHFGGTLTSREQTD